MPVIEAADLFCGAGGTSSGLMKACDALGLKVRLTAVNHWQCAITTHQANHPSVRHLCASLSSIEPRKAVASKKLRLLLASPQCTDHSVCKSGELSDQSRSSAFHVLQWAMELRPDDIIIENVRQFLNWGPLNAFGRPIKALRGTLFKVFIDGLKAMGYRVEWRILNAADYGDWTSRERLFIRARLKGKGPIVWPEATHAGKWKPAREIIDWTLPGESIFNRKNPLKPKTMARIEVGIRKFWGEWAEPFLVVLRNNQNAQSIEKPLPTMTTSGANFALVQPFMMKMANGGGLRDSSQPMPTITSADEFAVVKPFIVPQMSGGACRSVDQAVPTITTTSRGIRLVQPFILKYYGKRSAHSLEAPLDTVTTRDRFGLVTPDRLDIRFRMLQPHELSAAMGFAKDYVFTGTREERVKQIGNAVPVNMAAALCRSVLSA